VAIEATHAGERTHPPPGGVSPFKRRFFRPFPVVRSVGSEACRVELAGPPTAMSSPASNLRARPIGVGAGVSAGLAYAPRGNQTAVWRASSAAPRPTCVPPPPASMASCGRASLLCAVRRVGRFDRSARPSGLGAPVCWSRIASEVEVRSTGQMGCAIGRELLHSA
jgi:hypothetical protein